MLIKSLSTNLFSIMLSSMLICSQVVTVLPRHGEKERFFFLCLITGHAWPFSASLQYKLLQKGKTVFAQTDQYLQAILCFMECAEPLCAVSCMFSSSFCKQLLTADI